MRRVLITTMVVLLISGLAASAEEVRWLPVAASNTGLNGTVWTTDLWIFNRALDAPIEVKLAFLPDVAGTTTEPVEVTVTVPAFTSVVIHDPVGSLFSESRPGAIRLRSEHLFEARSRTYNDGGAMGTYGQGIPALAPSEALGGGVLLGAANIAGEDGVRTNVGILNPDTDDQKALVVIYDQATGATVGAKHVDVGPLGWTQFNPFELVGAADTDVSDAVVVVVSLPGVYTYLSRIDNRSGDAVFVLPFDATDVRLLPRDWTVQVTLTYSSSTTLSAFTYTGEDGADVTVESPASGWTATLGFISPATFCYTANGEAGEDGGSIDVELLLGPEGEQPARSAQHTENDGAGTLALHKCIDLD